MTHVPADRSTWPEGIAEIVDALGYAEGTLFLGQCPWPPDSAYDDAEFHVPRRTKKQPQFYLRVQAHYRKLGTTLYLAVPSEMLNPNDPANIQMLTHGAGDETLQQGARG